jgi:NTP pyrophosphatase (non-canonical NTP hydrolase)
MIMGLNELQSEVDKWINRYGVRYFHETTNALILMEEVGELSRYISRKFGEQSFKQHEEEQRALEHIGDELADILFVTVCLANQMGVNLDDAMRKNLQKKTDRDANRHRQNKKLDKDD